MPGGLNRLFSNGEVKVEKKQKKRKLKSMTSVQPQATVDESKDTLKDMAAEPNTSALPKYAPTASELRASVWQFPNSSHCWVWWRTTASQLCMPA